ncbi:hypothetical protein BN1049_03041 [Pseudomonas saudimassiliensis]|uniref:Uncharacterized protein n=2 Tax=Pseudomonas saudimassiliensis TaxID=1461581 RepID=A0A078MH98_9PSED|nr:hypothetical protein BN1049_03041 [Pseudomonas saudimassiliensis]CEF28059.1 hypothetical protein BN1049_03041 [Pseudomonas saudimassiliensis]
MTKNATFREIERKLAESLAQLEAKKEAEHISEEQAFNNELKTLMKNYRLSAADVLGIIRSAS